MTPSDDAGRDYLRGFKQGLGDHVGQIVAEAVYLSTDPTVDSQIVTLKSCGADVFFDECTPKFAAQTIRKAAEVGIAPHDGDEQSSPRSVRGGSPAHSDGRKSTGKA